MNPACSLPARGPGVAPPLLGSWSLPPNWPAALLPSHFIVAGLLLAGFALWAWRARRRPQEELSTPARLGLALLLAATPLAWWLNGLSLVLHPDGRLETPGLLSARIAGEVGLPPPVAVSFGQPDVRMIGNKNVLMLLPPARLEWIVDPSVQAVSLRFGFDPTAYTRGNTDGADLFLELAGPGTVVPLFHRLLKPLVEPADRGPQEALVILPPLAHEARLVLRTGPGPAGNAAWDWIYLDRLAFRRDRDLALRRYPGFNRAPDEIKGEQIGLLAGDDGKTVLFIATPGSLSFHLQASDHQVAISYGFMRTAYTNGGHTNGAVLRVELQSRFGQVTKLSEYYARPVEREADRGLLHATVALPPHEADDWLVVRLLPGDNNDAAWDHTFISGLTLQ